MADDTNKSAIKAAADTAAAANKVATELKSRLDKAPKPASPEALKAASERLVDFRWVEGMDAEKVAAALSDPTTALNTLAQVAQKAAEKIAQLTGGTLVTGRLDAGRIIDQPIKQAADNGDSNGPPVSQADVNWHEKMAARRQQLN